ncbi:hypothetical protein AYL99_04257 [Fonsecaea erecta]|uniref:Uncharacterized protein n=1 Tax=Fonsecaea erecta TaxID=1367422 RepID=A0A178ZQE5_9EURO|nr:hypothetical protein AYL99_04257 [Fonsecaea erecta]OAP62054.1 hypothetical protein AYL99_04257 [Fonsecaea erecta]
MAAPPHHVPYLFIERIGEGDVTNHTFLEEGPWPDPLGPVNNLIGDDKIPWLNFLGQTACRRKGDDTSHADMTQGGDVRTRGDLVGREGVVWTVASQEGDGDGFAGGWGGVFEDSDRRGWRAPGRVDGQYRGLVKIRQMLQPGATYHRDVHGTWEGNTPRVKRSDLFRDDDDAPGSRGSSRSVSPARSVENEEEGILKASYGFEYDFVAPNPSLRTSTLAPSKPAPDVNLEEEDQEFEFRLFTSTSKPTVRPSQPDVPVADSKIRLSRTPEPAELADSLSLERAHFLRPNRPDSYYFTSALPKETIEALRSQYADVALSTSEVLCRAESTKWPGSALPWRLIHVELLDKSHRFQGVAQSAVSAMGTRDSSSHMSQPRPKRPSKKRRILLRRRLALRQELAAQARVTEETEKEKRTRRNREKKVKRKEREKRKKMEAPEGEGELAGGEEGKGHERGEGEDLIAAEERDLKAGGDIKAQSGREGETGSKRGSAIRPPDLAATTKNAAVAAALSTNASQSSAPTRRAPTSRAPTTAAPVNPAARHIGRGR